MRARGSAVQEQEVATTAAGNCNSLTHTHTQTPTHTHTHADRQQSVPPFPPPPLFVLELLKVSNRFLTEVAHVRTCFLLLLYPPHLAYSPPYPIPLAYAPLQLRGRL